MDQRNATRLFYIVIGAAFIIRIALAWVNLDANDNHHKATQLMIQERSLTSYDDCAQCYHPKLFHASAAVLQVVLNIDSVKNQIRSGQFLNVLMGMILLLIIMRFIKYQSWKPNIQLLVFALIALNPKLIAINAQYTNDTFAFTFGALAILGVYRLIKRLTWRNMSFVLIGCLGASLSKGSGIPLTFGLLVFLLALYFQQKDKMVLRTLIITVTLFFVIVPLGGNYIENLKDSDIVLGLNGTTSPPPHLYKKTYIDRPGVISVVHSYMTFYFLDLIKNPYISNHHEGYALNRTSVASQIYGRTFSARFDQWPYSWMSLDRKILMTNRLLLILGIIPSLLFLMGLMSSTMKFIKGIRLRDFNVDWNVNFLMGIILASMIAMILKLTFDHRDFCTMKAIYMWPGLVSIVYFLGVGMQKIATKAALLDKAVIGAVLVSIGISIYECLDLIFFLYGINFA